MARGEITDPPVLKKSRVSHRRPNITVTFPVPIVLFPGEGRKESFRTLACGVMALEEEGGEKERRKKEAGRRRPGYVSAFFPGGTDTRKTGSNIRGEVF